MKWGPLAECRDCHAPMAWAKVTATGRAMPVHPHPVTGGNVAVMRDARDQLVARVLSATAPREQPYETLTVHHAAVCATKATARAQQHTQYALDEDLET